MNDQNNLADSQKSECMHDGNANASGYKDRTERINAWGKFGKILLNLLWVIVVIIILASIGKYLSQNENITPEHGNLSTAQEEVSITKPVNWQVVDQSIRDAVTEARNKSKQVASEELDQWVNGLMERVDGNFLDWYFSYWKQQKMGLKSLWYEIVHWIDDGKPTAAEKVTETIQKEFSNRVLRPQISQLKLERITRDTVNNYVISLGEKLKALPEKYKISQQDWNRHLIQLASITTDVNGNREADLSLKTIATSTAAGTVAAAKAVAPAVKAIGTKVSVKFAGKAAAKMAAKTGGKVAAKAGGKLLGPIVGIGIVIWDVWDHYSTEKENRPLLSHLF